jgi:TolB-like protein/Flp pilus assembly protein TadD/tRNA A-37 threonylcarbamoyl transferase component Bud32
LSGFQENQVNLLAADFLERLRRALGDRYRIDRELGRGGMATVYLALDFKHDRQVALKILKPDLAAAVGPERFLREIKLTARLDHPHILPLLDSGEAEGLLYYVMPYVEGESLRDRLNREKQLPLDDALQIASEVADALSYAHSLGIVHRDIKPENVLLAGGHARVADFGIARALTAPDREPLTATGLAIGTPAYMSPEQASGGREVDARTDLYSLGCVVYEMLAGQPPYTGATAEAILARKSLEPVPRLRIVREGVPPGVEQAIMKALAKVPADRYRSAGEFAEALATRLAVAPEPVPLSRGRRNTWRLVGGLILTVAALVAGWWGIAEFRGKVPAIRSLAVLPFDNLTANPAQDYFVDGVHEMLTNELSRIGALTVISRTSAIQYKGIQMSPTRIASELGVTGLVKGSVLREAEWVRITVQLIHGPSGRTLWTQSFDRELRGILALYSDVARAMTQAIGIAVTPDEETRLARARPVKPEAYDAFLRGTFYANQSTPEGFERGLRYLREAIERDSTHPLPYVSLALALNRFGHGAARPPGVFSEAKLAALKALELDETLAEAHAALGEMKLAYEWDWPGAERSFRRALELNPDLAISHLWYGWYLLLFGRKDEAVAEIERARELDPMTPLHLAYVAWAYWVAGEDEAAIKEGQRALDHQPDPYVLYVLGSVYAQNGRYEEAVAAHQRAAAINPFWTWGLGVTHALAGRKNEARTIAAEYEKGTLLPPELSRVIDRFARDHVEPKNGSRTLKGYRRDPRGLVLVHPWGLAELYAALGEKEKALQWLEVGIEQRQSWMPWMGKHPSLRSLRRDVVHVMGRDNPQFQELLRRMNLPN